MSIGQIMAECDCQHTACDLRGYCMAARIAELEAENARLRDEVAALKSPPEEYCAKCGSPKSNHPYRHPFTPRAALDKGEG